ncbi:M12 family metallo-peptidase [Emticicia sp. SJ17W-69]|uniref:M12 family metallo-peptidase n=1 Tax=Emticicia sp. SJ17W-69 TaxID=3421657 RepID=UPI003EBDFB58
MRKVYFWMLFFLTITYCQAQNKVYKEVLTAQKNNVAVKTSSIFTLSTRPLFDSTFKAGSEVMEFSVNNLELNNIQKQNPKLLNLSVPFSNNMHFDLVLIPIDIFSPTYKVVNSKNEEIKIEKGIYYQGIIDGDSLSLVALSINNGEISGIIANKDGNYNLGKLKNSSRYVLYNDKDLAKKNNFSCETSDIGLKNILSSEVKNNLNTNTINCSTIQIYFEADSTIFAANGFSINTTANFVNRLFSQVVILYNNENIAVQMSELKIWDTTDPYFYLYPNTGTFLNTFKNQIGTTFNGDIAHLLSGRSNGGRADEIDGLFSKGAAVSAGITNTIDNVPIYSYNVEVVTHEIGHHFGSPHTHSCSWPGGPLDNCLYPEGNCGFYGPPIVNGGTIMSYCHIFYTINFNNGFGPLPGNLVRNHTKIFLGGGVHIPVTLAINDIYNSRATISWEHTGGGTYIVEYKPTNSNVWTSDTTTENYSLLTELSPNTIYNLRINVYDPQVKAGCASFTDTTFSTNNTPPVNYCTPTFVSACGIFEVIINGITLESSGLCLTEPFKFFPSRSLSIGQNTFSIKIFSEPQTELGVWVDFNKDGVFAENEKVFFAPGSRTTPGHEIFASSFLIPNTVVPQQNTRLRIVTTNYNFEGTPLTPCGDFTYGQMKDYLVNITGNCEPLVSLENPINNISAGRQIIKASSQNGVINASNLVEGTNTNAVYQSKKIHLKPGFKVSAGAFFKAQVGGCN